MRFPSFQTDVGSLDLVDPAKLLKGQLANYLNESKGAFSNNTERALRADVEIFTLWCERNGVTAFPACTATIVQFIDDMAEQKAPATVRRYMSSLATVHKVIGADNPIESHTVRLALQRMHRLKGRRQHQVQGLTWPLRQRLMEAAGDRVIDARNCALLAVAYDALLRRSELVSLHVEDLMIEMDGAGTLIVRKSKTDPEGTGSMQFLAKDSVTFVEDWCRRSGVADGYLFRSVRKDGTTGECLHASQVPRIYKTMARAAGLPESVVETISGHSPRVGSAQDMVACGIGLPAILQAGRWKSTAMVQRYGERLLVRHSAAAQLAEHQHR